MIEVCPHCGSTDIEFIDDGEYQCKTCLKTLYDGSEIDQEALNEDYDEDYLI